MNLIYTHPDFDLLWWDGGYWVKVKDPEGIGSEKLGRISPAEARELLHTFIHAEMEPASEPAEGRGDPASGYIHMQLNKIASPRGRRKQ